jgi:hypothetical protein
MEDGSAPDVSTGTFSSVRHARIVPMPGRPEKDRPDKGVAPVVERLLRLPAAVSRVLDPAGDPDKAGRPRVLRAVAQDGAAQDGALVAIIGEAVLGPSGVILC